MTTTMWGRSLADAGAVARQRPGETAFPEQSRTAARRDPSSHCTFFVIDLLSDAPVRAARHAADEWLKTRPTVSEDVRYFACLAVSELVTNAVRASSSLPPARQVPDPSPILGVCSLDDGSVSVTVHDFGVGVPEPRVADDEADADEDGEDDGGRGLVLVEGFSVTRGVHRGATTADGVVTTMGKRVQYIVTPDKVKAA